MWKNRKTIEKNSPTNLNKSEKKEEKSSNEHRKKKRNMEGRSHTKSLQIIHNGNKSNNNNGISRK